MSYGASSKSRLLANVWARDDGPPSTVVNTIASEVWSRSGTNKNVPFAKFRKKKNKRARYEIVKETYAKRITRRIANPAYPLNSKKKYIYYNENATRFRIKKIPLPHPRENSISKLAVNNLSYQREEFQDLGAPDITILPVPGGSYSPSWRRSIKGNTAYLGTSFPVGWGTGSPSKFHPSNYTAGSLAGDYSATISRLTAAATRKIYSKSKDQNVNLQNFLAELKSCKTSFVGIVQRISKTILLLKKGQLARAARTMLPTNSKELANDVLLYKFGIAPVLSDIDGMLKHLAQNAKDTIVVVKAVSSDVVRTTSSGFVSSSILSRKETISTETKITVRTVFSYKVDLPAIQQLIQLGFTNPATTAYELMPWSFVLDWLLPIGDYLDSLDSWAMLQPVSFHTTVFIDQKVLCTAVNGGIAGSADYKTKTSPSSSLWMKRNVSCTRLTGPLPAPPLPRLQNPFSVSRLISSAALLRQLRP